jgi:hypothetical protein
MTGPKEPLTLYHFTSPEYLKSIKQHGIIKGDVPTSPVDGFNAPWLTDNDSWSMQSWSRGSVLDKSSVRMTVEVPVDDPNLVLWSELAEEENVTEAWYNILNETAGGSAKHWYVYRGKVPVEWITQIEDRPKFSFGQGCSTSRIGEHPTARQTAYMRAYTGEKAR